MTGPLATLRLKHAMLEVWGPDEHCARGHVLTRFPDGLTVPAAPNGDETLTDTLAHELAHHLYAELRHDAPSACLRGVAEGHGRRWTDAKHEEETAAYRLGLQLAAAMKALKDG